VNRVFDQDVYKMTTGISGLWRLVKRKCYIRICNHWLFEGARKPIFFLKKHCFPYFSTVVISGLYKLHYLILFFSPFNDTISGVNITDETHSAKYIIYHTTLKTKVKCISVKPFRHISLGL